MTTNESVSKIIVRRLEQKKRSLWLSLSIVVIKNHSKNYFFAIITSLSIISLLLTSFYARAEYSMIETRSDLASMTEALVQVFVQDSTNLQDELNQIESNLLENLSPVSSFVGLDSKISRDFDQARNLLEDWLSAVRPLAKYQLTVKGLLSRENQNRFFTTDLENLIKNLEEGLLKKTEKTWQDFGFYLNLANFGGNQRINAVKNLVESSLILANKLIEYQDPILTILGHSEKQRIVVFNQNTGEARPTGGFIGSYISIDIYKGQININESNSIYYPDGSIEEQLYMHPATSYYSWNSGFNRANDHGIRNANFLPCFPETASLIHKGFLMSSNGYPIDLIGFITPQLLLDFLGTDFSFDVPDVGTLNSSNIMDEVERITALEIEDETNPKKQIKDILENLLGQIPRILSQREVLDWTQLVIRAIQSRDLQLWSSKTELQSFFEKTGLTNLAMCNRSKIEEVGFLLGNISGDKRNLVTENHFNIFTETRSTGTKINVKYKQLTPAKPDLQRDFKRESSFTFVGLQVPANSQSMHVSSPQALYAPFTREYYQEIFKNRTNSELTLLPEIEYIIRTSKNLYNENGNPPGFVYEHSNGSKVLGIYIHDNSTFAEVEFSFILPEKDLIKFYSQPGLREPLLGLGKGVELKNKTNGAKVINDYYQINSGVLIKI